NLPAGCRGGRAHRGERAGHGHHRPGAAPERPGSRRRPRGLLDPGYHQPECRAGELLPAPRAAHADGASRARRTRHHGGEGRQFGAGPGVGLGLRLVGHGLVARLRARIRGGDARAARHDPVEAQPLGGGELTFPGRGGAAKAAPPEQVTQREDRLMNSMHRWLLIAALTAVVAALGAACDGEETEGKSLCDGVDCAAPLTCDPSDGVCKCGTGDSRMICKSNEVCVVTAEGVPFCTEDRCVSVVCDRNETCDPTDGVCKCGATTCSEGEICVQNRCGVPDPCAGQACPEGQTCDSTDGRCKCGGEICADNESCVDGVCVDDPCKGVNCPQNSVCNPEDRACHCGTETGPVCETGQACVNEEGDWICRGARDKCEAVACSGDAVCDLDTGACCCGGTGDACVVCEEGQLCYRGRSEEHTSELQSRENLVCRLLLEKKKQ